MWVSSTQASNGEASQSTQSGSNRSASSFSLRSLRLGESPETARFTTSARRCGAAHWFNHSSRWRTYISSSSNSISHRIRRPEHENPVSLRILFERNLRRPVTMAVRPEPRPIPRQIQIRPQSPAKIGRYLENDAGLLMTERKPSRRRPGAARHKVAALCVEDRFIVSMRAHLFRSRFLQVAAQRRNQFRLVAAGNPRQAARTRSLEVRLDVS